MFVNKLRIMKVSITQHKIALVILKIKDLKTTNRDHKKVTKQGSRYSSVGI